LLNPTNNPVRQLGQLPRNFSDMFYKEFLAEMNNDSHSQVSASSDKNMKAASNLRNSARNDDKNESSIQKFSNSVVISERSCPSESLSLLSECGEIDKSINENQDANSLRVT